MTMLCKKFDIQSRNRKIMGKPGEIIGETIGAAHVKYMALKIVMNERAFLVTDYAVQICTNIIIPFSGSNGSYSWLSLKDWAYTNANEKL